MSDVQTIQVFNVLVQGHDGFFRCELRRVMAAARTYRIPPGFGRLNALAPPRGGWAYQPTLIYGTALPTIGRLNATPPFWRTNCAPGTDGGAVALSIHMSQ